MATTKGPSLPNIEPLIAAGIDPKTGLPIKVAGTMDSWRKENIKMNLRVLDEQNAVNRYVWHNLPCDISSQELERMLYYKGQLCMFYCEPLEQFYFMPYALNGGLDFYGRFKSIHPIPFANGTSDAEKAEIAKQRNFLSTLKLDVVYDVPIVPVNPLTSCVLIHDYTKQLSQTCVPRQQMMDPLLDIMSDCIPFMRTSLLNSTGVQGMRVNSQDEASNVEAASRSIDRAALEGKKYIPIVGAIEFQEMTGGQTAKAEEFLMAMQSLDNFRLSLYGLDNGGLFQKKSHMLEAEQEMNAGVAKSALNDGLAIRQRMCDIANALWGIGMSCEIAETALGIDKNIDGIVTDETDQSGTMQGDQPEYQEGGEEE